MPPEPGSGRDALRRPRGDGAGCGRVASGGTGGAGRASSSATGCGSSPRSSRSCSTTRHGQTRPQRPPTPRAVFSSPWRATCSFRPPFAAPTRERGTSLPRTWMMCSPCFGSSTRSPGNVGSRTRSTRMRRRSSRRRGRAAGRRGVGRAVVPRHGASRDRRRQRGRIRSHVRRDRVAHVHLKDADLGLGGRVAARDLSLLEATRLGLFRPLGRGDVPVKDVVEILEESGYPTRAGTSSSRTRSSRTTSRPRGRGPRWT